jgi:hypothetical protein
MCAHLKHVIEDVRRVYHIAEDRGGAPGVEPGCGGPRRRTAPVRPDRLPFFFRTDPCCYRAGPALSI